MSAIPICAGPGLGFRFGEKDIWLTANATVSQGDVVQLVMTSSGDFTNFSASGVGNAAFTGVTYTNGTKLLNKTAAFASVPDPKQLISISGATYTDATKTITKTAAFTNYTFYATDRIYVSGGTGATVALYSVASRVSADAITLTASIGAGADGVNDIAGIVTSPNNYSRIKITGGTGATAGVYVLGYKLSADLGILTASIGAGADGQTDIALTVLDNELQHGFFAVAMEDITSGTIGRLRIVGPCSAFTKNAADAAIAQENLFCPDGSKNFESDTASYGLNAKLVAKAVDTALVSTTATRAKRRVIVNGIYGWGGTYQGTA